MDFPAVEEFGLSAAPTNSAHEFVAIISDVDTILRIFFKSAFGLSEKHVQLLNCVLSVKTKNWSF